MAKLPFSDKSIKDIMIRNDIVEVNAAPRPYLGMSSIGDPCMRKLWYSLHWVSPKSHPPRVARIFERGHWEEHRIIRDLKVMGIECFRRDKDGNKIEIFGHIDEEQEEIVGFAGHALGHNDGRALGIPDAPKAEHLLEFKTANDKSFKEFVKKGVEEKDIVYYSQMQKYMGHLGLTRALFIVTNKNDESRYVERVPFRKGFYEDLCAKEQHIIMSEMPLDKIGGPTWYQCKFCDHYGVCHNGDAPQRNCRTCDSSDMLNGGKWGCSFEERDLSTDEQRAGCQMWKKGWGL